MTADNIMMQTSFFSNQSWKYVYIGPKLGVLIIRPGQVDLQFIVGDI